MADELNPCKYCGAACRVETYDTELVKGDLYFCSNASVFGGSCSDTVAYMTVENWNCPRSTEEQLADEIITEILTEEAVKELETLDLRERQPFNVPGYWESDRDFLAYGHNHKAAALLLGIYIRQRRTT